jgi:hypothetical protein
MFHFSISMGHILTRKCIFFFLIEKSNSTMLITWFILRNNKLEQEGNVRGFTYGEPGYGGAVDGLEQPHSYIL